MWTVVKDRVCPKCGHELVVDHPYWKGWIICMMNMPFQGCGWKEKLKS